MADTLRHFWPKSSPSLASNSGSASRTNPARSVPRCAGPGVGGEWSSFGTPASNEHPGNLVLFMNNKRSIVKKRNLLTHVLPAWLHWLLLYYIFMARYSSLSVCLLRAEEAIVSPSHRNEEALPSGGLEELNHLSPFFFFCCGLFFNLLLSLCRCTRDSIKSVGLR